MKNIAVILSGGCGVRFGNRQPKQFITIAGKMIIEHTIQVFQNHPKIDEIIVVGLRDSLKLCGGLFDSSRYSKVTKIIPGGAERSDSSLAALNTLAPDVNVIIHDAVRPLVSNRIISECVSALAIFNAVNVVIPVTDTIVEVNNNLVVGIPNRSKLGKCQTPQAFKSFVLKSAYEIALKDKEFSATDDCGVVSKYLPNEKIYVVKGEEKNIKLTHKEDLLVIENAIQGHNRE
jgi:2-C-methyl-D-erythritol 4-phosphate cytidylyltransferase